MNRVGNRAGRARALARPTGARPAPARRQPVQPPPLADGPPAPRPAAAARPRLRLTARRGCGPAPAGGSLPAGPAVPVTAHAQHGRRRPASRTPDFSPSLLAPTAAVGPGRSPTAISGPVGAEQPYFCLFFCVSARTKLGRNRRTSGQCAMCKVVSQGLRSLALLLCENRYRIDY
jgi:hypothetical protein